MNIKRKRIPPLPPIPDEITFTVRTTGGVRVVKVPKKHADEQVPGAPKGITFDLIHGAKITFREAP